MSEFRHLDTKEPAEMGTVLEAVVRLSTLSEDEILSLVSERHLEDSFSFSAQAQEPPPDFVDEADLDEASALPLSRPNREALIQASMPPSGSPMSIDRLAAALAKQEEILRSAEQASHG